MAKKKNLFGVNTYVKRTKPKIGRHKKGMSKSEKKNYKKNNILTKQDILLLKEIEERWLNKK